MQWVIRGHPLKLYIHKGDIMITDKLKGFISLGILLLILGLFFLFNSVDFGTSLAIAKQGGADTALYHISVKGYINSFLTVGSTLFGVGLTTAIFTLYKLITHKR